MNPGHFETFGARILAGRDFNAADTPDKSQVYIISEHLAKTYFHKENPVGNYMLRNGSRLPVIGVVSDIRDQGPRQTNLDTVYQDAGQLLVSSLYDVCAVRRRVRTFASYVATRHSNC